MNNTLNQQPRSDAEWYLRDDAESKIFYGIFFEVCKKYQIRWASATKQERAFVEEVTRVTYERGRAVREGRSVKSVRAAFTA